MSSEKNPNPTPASLLWEDLFYLSQQKLCLRTVTDKETAKKEQIQGGTGDAVSLSTFGYPGADCASDIHSFLQQKNWLPPGTLKDDYVLVISWLSSQYSDCIMSNFPQAKSELVQRFNDGIREHLQKAFFYSDRPAFILLSNQTANLVYDLNKYSLGKLGKQLFSNEQVKAIIAESNSTIWNSETAFTAIVAEIKQLILQPVHQESYQSVFQPPISSQENTTGQPKTPNKNIDENKEYIPVGLQDARLGAEFTRDLNSFDRENSRNTGSIPSNFPDQTNLKVDVKSDASSRILKSDGYRIGCSLF